jgi:AhpD family alkylhydroperoxidase
MPGPALPRIAPGTRREIGTVNWVVAWVSGRVAGTGPPNLFRVLGRQRGLFRGWLHFAGKMMPGGKLSRRETELVILRVAALTGCTYEQEHHRRLARRSKVAELEIDNVLVGDVAGFTEREQAILTAAAELIESGDLSDETWMRLREKLDEGRCIELVLLVGHYEMLAKTISTLRIPLDSPRRS